LTGKIFAITTYHESNLAKEAAEEWKVLGICAIGWSPIKFCLCQNKEEIRQKLKANNYQVRGVEDIFNFIHMISEGDLVLAYSRNNTIAYIGEVDGPCEFKDDNSVGDPNGRFSYPTQRRVQWWDEPHHFDRRNLPGDFARQFGKRGVTVAEIDPYSKGFTGFKRLIEACANSGSRLPGLNEDTVKAGIVKYLYASLDDLEDGLKILKAEVAIGKDKRKRPDFIAKDKSGRTVIIECKGTAGEDAVDQILEYQREYREDTDSRLMIIAFRISNSCKSYAKRVGNIELVECNLQWKKLL